MSVRDPAIDAENVRALADKMHELFLVERVDKFTVFAAMGTCIAETYTDPKLIEDALSWVRQLATGAADNDT